MTTLAAHAAADRALPAEPTTACEAAVQLTDHLPAMLAAVEQHTTERALHLVAVLHDVDEHGRCRVCVECQPSGPWWRRRPGGTCPTRRVISTELCAGLESVSGDR